MGDYWTCPYCGANLDNDEKCNCQQGSTDNMGGEVHNENTKGSM